MDLLVEAADVTNYMRRRSNAPYYFKGNIPVAEFDACLSIIPEKNRELMRRLGNKNPDKAEYIASLENGPLPTHYWSKEPPCRTIFSSRPLS